MFVKHLFQTLLGLLVILVKVEHVPDDTSEALVGKTLQMFDNVHDLSEKKKIKK